MISILLADDHPYLRRGLSQILTDEFSGAVIGETSNVPELLEQARQRRWDVVVLDLTMPGRSGLEGLRELKRLFPHLPILVLSMHPDDQFAVRVLRAGGSGYLTKESAPQELVQAIKVVSRGGKYITPKAAELLASHVHQQGDHEQPLHSSLSDREDQVFRLIAGGRTITEISDQLSLSIKTVSTYRTRILEKLNLKTNADLARYAVQHHLVE
ncbi:MAG: response regulator transcription factor [Nitrospira sp.]|jgi:DNA-binding NarL/FixJ family response regulator|nr:response regulator transcription factor [Nitrospira sp.]MDC8447140.1 response regulator transcription factor [Nitrospira sp.]MDI3461707.1 Two-component transcriptional response regulator, LuxR family [Nitrospira sp.]